MGTPLTGTTPQDTYDALIKVGDNGIITGSLKTLSDGFGNDTALALSDSAASVTGTLAVSGAATFDTTTLVVDATNNRVGIATASPAYPLDVVGAAQLSGELYMGNNQFLRFVRSSGSLSLQTLGIPTGTDDVRLLTTGDFNVVTGGLTSLLAVKASGNVLIGTTSDNGAKLQVDGTANATQFLTTTGTVVAPLSVATTFFTAASKGLYLAHVYLGGSNTQTWSATIFFVFQSTNIMIINQTNGVNVSTSVSGTDVQVTQIGGASFTMGFDIIKIA
jgi:hypothetical protein